MLVNVSMPIFSVPIVASAVAPPIRMVPCPIMKTPQPDGITNQPDIARSQIDILVANDADVFITIPDIHVRNQYGFRFDWGWSYHHRRLGNYEWLYS